ncbi:MAG TPA: hypothetical protein VNM24_14745 [Burkholderiales bacterium]|nr:hypothetical protein [Burkholderiales bacterium]
MINSKGIQAMHFRFRGNNVQVVKSQLDPKTGKAKSVPIGSINLARLEIGDKLASNCSAAELKEIENWLKRRRGIEELKAKVAALTLPENISSALKWFAKAPPEEIEEVADDVLVGIRQLRKVLQKRVAV